MLSNRECREQREEKEEERERDWSKEERIQQIRVKMK